MLTLVLGGVGTGKTLLLAYMASKLDDKIPIYSNFFLALSNYIQFSISEFINGYYESGNVLLDEAYSYIESRLSGSDRNRYMSYMLFQSRKKNLHLQLTAQLESTLDLRFRNMADYIVYAKGLNTNKAFEYSIFNAEKRQFKNFSIPAEKYEPVFNIYDTFEVITPSGLDKEAFSVMTLEEQKQYVQNAIKLFETTNLPITHDSVKSFLWNQNLDSSINKILYTELKMRKKQEE